MIFHSWYDRLQEPWRFMMMFVVLSPFLIGIWFNKPLLTLCWAVVALASRWYYLTRK